MSTKVLTEGQVSDMKQNGVNVIFNGCDASVSKDRNLPTTAWLMTCKLRIKSGMILSWEVELQFLIHTMTHLVRM